MAFQAPDTWYYAQNDGLLEKAYNEINEVIKAKNIDPDKVFVSGMFSWWLYDNKNVDCLIQIYLLLQ